jgi:hypothetical protein
MKSLLKAAVLFVTLSSSVYSFLNAQVTDSVGYAKDFDLLPQKQIWLQTTNPIAFSRIDEQGMNSELSYNCTTGSYKYISDPQSQGDGKIRVDGFKQINKLHLYGGFSYGISRLHQQKWKDVLLLSPRNPFVLTDSIGGNYDNESFEIRGAASSFVNDRLQWGLAVTYIGGTSSDNNDPRPSIDAMRFSVHPGIRYQWTSHWGIGIDARYERYKENISIEVLETNITHRFFYFQGLGNFYLNTGTSNTRTYNGNMYEGNIQFDWQKNNLENIFQLGYKQNSEESITGLLSSSSIFRSGDYVESTLSLGNIFSIKSNDIRHSFKFNVEYSPNKGTWYDQKQVKNSDSQIVWEVYNKSVKYKSTSIISKAEYNWLKEKDGYLDYSLSGSVGFEQEDTKFLPDYFLQKYSNMQLSLAGTKMIKLPKYFSLNLTAKIGYKHNLSANSDFNGITLANVWTYPVYEYFTANHYQGVIGLKLSKKTRIGNAPGTIYLSLKADYVKADIESTNFNKPHRLGLFTACGFTF